MDPFPAPTGVGLNRTFTSDVVHNWWYEAFARTVLSNVTVRPGLSVHVP
jgi:hypothetical protein